jgi:hypothetical protein
MTPTKIETYAALQGISVTEFLARTTRYPDGFPPAFVRAAELTAGLSGADASEVAYRATATHAESALAAALAEIAADRYAARLADESDAAATLARWAADALALKHLADSHAGGAA